VVDYGNNTIRQIVISTGAVTTLAGTAGVSGSADGTGGAAQFNGPRGISTDGVNLYVSDTDNNTIRQIVISTGAVTTLAGTAGVTGSADGMGGAAQFNFPYGVTIGGTNLYVVEQGNNTIRQIVISTGAVTTLAGTAGVSGSADGTGGAAQFNQPDGITIDGSNLYVSDTMNNTIREVVISTGAVTTLAGTAGVTGSLDGIGSAALFNQPRLPTVLGTALYVADSMNNTIRKVVISTGAVTTLAGTAGVAGSVDGIGSAALLNQPRAIGTDGANLYVSDTGNNTIRQIM